MVDMLARDALGQRDELYHGNHGNHGDHSYADAKAQTFEHHMKYCVTTMQVSS